MRFVSRLTFAAVLIAAALAPAQSQTQTRRTADVGVWYPGVSEPNGKECLRLWHCLSPAGIEFDGNEKVDFTPVVKTLGQCADDECKICAAPPPQAACGWVIALK